MKQGHGHRDWHIYASVIDAVSLLTSENCMRYQFITERDDDVQDKRGQNKVVF